MDLRDYISGDDTIKDIGVNQVMASAVVFSIRIVEILSEYIDEIPDAMKQDVGDAVSSMLSGAGEFVDMDALMGAFGEE